MIKSKVNINTAQFADLLKLPGIGRVLAQRIVEHRNSKGEITDLDELLQIHGINAAKLKLLLPYLAISNRKPNITNFDNSKTGSHLLYALAAVAASFILFFDFYTHEISDYFASPLLSNYFIRLILRNAILFFILFNALTGISVALENSQNATKYFIAGRLAGIAYMISLAFISLAPIVKIQGLPNRFAIFSYAFIIWLGFALIYDIVPLFFCLQRSFPKLLEKIFNYSILILSALLLPLNVLSIFSTYLDHTDYVKIAITVLLLWFTAYDWLLTYKLIKLQIPLFLGHRFAFNLSTIFSGSLQRKYAIDKLVNSCTDPNMKFLLTELTKTPTVLDKWIIPIITSISATALIYVYWLLVSI